MESVCKYFIYTPCTHVSISSTLHTHMQVYNLHSVHTSSSVYMNCHSPAGMQIHWPGCKLSGELNAHTEKLPHLDAEVSVEKYTIPLSQAQELNQASAEEMESPAFLCLWKLILINKRSNFKCVSSSMWPELSQLRKKKKKKKGELQNLQEEIHLHKSLSRTVTGNEGSTAQKPMKCTIQRLFPSQKLILQLWSTATWTQRLLYGPVMGLSCPSGCFWTCLWQVTWGRDKGTKILGSVEAKNWILCLFLTNYCKIQVLDNELAPDRSL